MFHVEQSDQRCREFAFSCDEEIGLFFYFSMRFSFLRDLLEWNPVHSEMRSFCLLPCNILHIDHGILFLQSNVPRGTLSHRLEISSSGEIFSLQSFQHHEHHRGSTLMTAHSFPNPTFSS